MIRVPASAIETVGHKEGLPGLNDHPMFLSEKQIKATANYCN